jgi:hypothetical protein
VVEEDSMVAGSSTAMHPGRVSQTLFNTEVVVNIKYKATPVFYHVKK